jgi:hypothetical protein
VQSEAKKKKGKKSKNTTSKTRRRKEAVILDVSGSLMEPSGVDMAGSLDVVPDGVADVSVCDGIPF